MKLTSQVMWVQTPFPIEKKNVKLKWNVNRGKEHEIDAFSSYLDIIVTVSPKTACVYDSRSKKKLARVIATVEASLPWKYKQIALNRF